MAGINGHANCSWETSPPPAVTGGKGEPFWQESGVVWRFRRLGTGVLPAALEAVAVAVHLQDVDVVGEAVQQSPGEPFGSEDCGPLVEGEVGGDQGRSPVS